MIKRLDKFLIINFLPPFLVSFVVALFVLVMQTLWLYIDDIAGKGVSLLNLLEMIAYLSVGLVPKALPIGILIASVMVFGGLAERYELSSLKSAGVSLLRVLRPAIYFSIFVALFSLFCSEYLIPVANLKFISRLHDIRKKKSTLTFEEGIFNDDFGNMVIHIGEKSDNNRDISNIKIYDQGNGTDPNQLKLITAKRGEMYPTENGSYFIMRLFDGIQYEDLNKSKRSQYPFTTSSFEEWTKVFDLSEFDLSETDNDLFKNHQATMTTAQLKSNIDSLQYQIGVGKNKIVYNYNKLADLKIDSNYIELNKAGPDDGASKGNRPTVDDITDIKKLKKHKDKKNLIVDQAMIEKDTMFNPKHLSILSLFEKKSKKREILKKALQHAENYERRIKGGASSLDNLKDRLVKHVFELHTKLAFALVCIIFVFIGGPMGAIVRKGGFGYPLLISVIFFVVYILMTTSLRRVCEGGEFDPVFGAWLPNIFTFVCGAVLTYLALNDSNLKLGNPLRWMANIWTSFRA